MKIIFSKSSLDVLPQLTKKYCFYDSCIEWLKNTPENTEIEHLELEYLDRGVKNWKTFGTLLKATFPNLKYFTFEMNYYYNQKKDDEWKTAETFFVEMELDYLSIEWFQEFIGHAMNEHGSDTYSVQVFLSRALGDEPDDFEDIKKNMSDRIQLFVSDVSL